MERRQQSRIDDFELQEFFRKFEDEFYRKFQRDMPGEARRYLHLAEQVIRNGEQELRSESPREGIRS
ncbi:MAG TPA: hypothetical protein VJR04_14820 [Terriglobales bacterium]|jgi:hypothetical protein|nr:hypothetical protein [Terriglobales bacterium]